MPAFLLLTLFFLSFRAPAAFALGENTGLKLNAVGDLTGQFGARDEAAYPTIFTVREAELSVYGPLDHNFDGAAIFAAHRENGEPVFEVHELYLSSNKLLPQLRVKAGYFFLGVGRINSMHRHDWPFFNAPKYHATFFDEEAAADSGVEAAYLFSSLPVFTELTLGLTSGWTFGHSHDQGEKPLQPTHYARLGNFFPLGETGGLYTGLNYLGHVNRADGSRQIYGLDLTAKWQEAGVTRWLLQSEIFGRTLKPRGADTSERALGGYLYAQRQVSGRMPQVGQGQIQAGQQRAHVGGAALGMRRLGQRQAVQVAEQAHHPRPVVPRHILHCWASVTGGPQALHG